jgi:hypothetical protein
VETQQAQVRPAHELTTCRVTCTRLAGRTFTYRARADTPGAKTNTVVLGRADAHSTNNAANATTTVLSTCGGFTWLMCSSVCVALGAQATSLVVLCSPQATPLGMARCLPAAPASALWALPTPRWPTQASLLRSAA